MSVIKKNKDNYNKKTKSDKPSKQFNDYLPDKFNINDDIYKDLSKEFEFMCGNTPIVTNAIPHANDSDDKNKSVPQTNNNKKINIEICVTENEIKNLENIINIIIELKNQKK